MKRETIETWVAAGESETLEFKATTGERRAGTQTLCGMLNHRGGRVLYGVADDGTITGQAVGDRTIEDLSAEIGRIDPPGFPTIDRVPVGDGREVLVVTEALFEPHESLPWNPLIARAFFRRGVIESWGRGTLKMVELLRQAGLPKPEIEDAGGCVTVRFRPSRYVPPQRVAHDLTERQREVLGLLGAAPFGQLALREIRAQLDPSVPEWAVKEDLAVLRQLRLVATYGHGRGAYWTLAKPKSRGR